LNSRGSNIKKWGVLPTAAVVVFLLTQAAASFPEVTEQWYSQKFYRLIAVVFSNVSAVFPFSLDDVFYILLIISFIILVFLVIIRKLKLLSGLNILLNTLAAGYILFYVLWGFNYFRSDLNERLNLKEVTPDTEIFTRQFKILVEETNKSYCKFDNFNKTSIDSLVEESYKNLSLVLQINYPGGKRRAKKITFSHFFAKAGISGYYGPFFSEVHINNTILPEEYPFVLAHEKAHQFGITSEAEANFYAWLACITSNSKQLQYSANLQILRFFLYQGYSLKNYKEITSGLDGNVKTDYRKIQEHWEQLRNEKVDKIATKVNDTYLKTNKIEKGIEDYTGVVKFVMDFSQDSVFQQKWDFNPD